MEQYYDHHRKLKCAGFVMAFVMTFCLVLFLFFGQRMNVADEYIVMCFLFVSALSVTTIPIMGLYLRLGLRWFEVGMFLSYGLAGVIEAIVWYIMLHGGDNSYYHAYNWTGFLSLIGLTAILACLWGRAPSVEG
jgi:hypothetical protein